MLDILLLEYLTDLRVHEKNKVWLIITRQANAAEWFNENHAAAKVAAVCFKGS